MSWMDDIIAAKNAGQPAALNFDASTWGANNPLVNADGTLKQNARLGFDSKLPQFQDQLNTINLNKDGLQAIRDRAIGSGTSPWLSLQRQALDNKMGQMRDDSVQQGATAGASAMSALARTGGLSSGARERVLKNNASNQMMSGQQLARFGNEQGVGLNIADEQMKQQALMQLPGMENQAIQPDIQKANAMMTQLGKEQSLGVDVGQYNLGTAKDELTQKRAFDLSQYQEKMKAWAAGKTADAQANAGKK